MARMDEKPPEKKPPIFWATLAAALVMIVVLAALLVYLILTTPRGGVPRRLETEPWLATLVFGAMFVALVVSAFGAAYMLKRIRDKRQR